MHTTEAFADLVRAVDDVAIDRVTRLEHNLFSGV